MSTQRHLPVPWAVAPCHRNRRPGSAIAAFVVSIFVALLLSPAAVLAQDPDGWIVVTEPGEWSENRLLSAPVGTTLRVVGQAYHPGGVASITVNGVEAERHPGDGGTVHFHAFVRSEAGLSTVSVELTPTRGEPLVRLFPLAVTGVEVAREPVLPSVAAPHRPSPGGALVRGVIPGLGQVYTGRPVLGAAVFGATAGAVALGVLSTETTVRCLAPLTDGRCPPDQVHSESSARPYLVYGISAAAILSGLAAAEAYFSAKRLVRVGLSMDGPDLAVRIRFILP